MKAALRSIASVVAASAFVVAAGGGGRETPSKTEMNMALEIRPARTSYAPGDKIEIVCTVSNASTGVELFLPWTDGAGWLECRDRSSALVRPILLTLAEGAFEAGPKDFVLLRPGQTHIVTLHGQL
jgi:hypothetical protein